MAALCLLVYSFDECAKMHLAVRECLTYSMVALYDLSKAIWFSSFLSLFAPSSRCMMLPYIYISEFRYYLQNVAIDRTVVQCVAFRSYYAHIR